MCYTAMLKIMANEFYGLFLATLERRPLKKSIGVTLFFVGKSKIFQQKITSPLKNPSSTPLERSEKQCVIQNSRYNSRMRNYFKTYFKLKALISLFLISGFSM
jgi:hypothetical protein